MVQLFVDGPFFIFCVKIIYVVNWVLLHWMLWYI